MTIKKLATLLAAAALFAGAPALAAERGHGTAPTAAAAGAKLTEAEQAKARTVEIAVTKAGFEPALVKVKMGESIKLVVTRKTERTCATEMVVKSEGVNVALPLDKPVTVYLKPARTGSIRYACAMDMIAGQLMVE